MKKLTLKKVEPPNFCHLHLHSMHSLLDGLGTSEEYCKKASVLGMTALACTDHGNINNLINHQRICEENNIHPVLGVEFYIVPNGDIKEKGEKRGHLTCFIKNAIGWKNVLKMLSKANLYNFYYRPRVDYQDILENSEGLIFGSACTASVLNLEGGEDFFLSLNKKTECYIELMPHSFEEQLILNKKCLTLHEEHCIPLIVTNDAHYVDREDSITHDVMLCIQTKKKINDPDRWSFTGDSFYLNSAKEMLDAFDEQGIVPKDKVLEAMKNTLIIAEKCNYRIENKEINLPEVPKYKGMDEEKVLIDLCEKGFESIFQQKISFRD